MRSGGQEVRRNFGFATFPNVPICIRFNMTYWFLTSGNSQRDYSTFFEASTKCYSPLVESPLWSNNFRKIPHSDISEIALQCCAYSRQLLSLRSYLTTFIFMVRPYFCPAQPRQQAGCSWVHGTAQLSLCRPHFLHRLSTLLPGTGDIFQRLSIYSH